MPSYIKLNKLLRSSTRGNLSFDNENEGEEANR